MAHEFDHFKSVVREGTRRVAKKAHDFGDDIRGGASRMYHDAREDITKAEGRLKQKRVDDETRAVEDMDDQEFYF